MAHLVWERFGNVPNYCEPFCGSCAVMLARPHEAKNETVNDADSYLANFWRSTAYAAEEVAKWADWPVSEVDLYARHKWLQEQVGFREAMLRDPQYFDPKIAGWWVWGISQWIGSGWCTRPEWVGRNRIGKTVGIHADLSRKRPNLNCRGIFSERIGGELHAYFDALKTRLRRVRVCCGDNWLRILGPSATTHIGLTGVFLDPPYSADRDAVYSQDSMFLSHEVREWALKHGDDPMMRIALCGYEDEHGPHMPASWEKIAWQANGGYGNQKAGSKGRLNATQERIWFSPNCLTV